MRPMCPSGVLGAGYSSPAESSRSCVVCVGAAMPDHGFAPAYKKINYPDRQRRDMSLKSASMISLTTRPLSAPSLEFVDTAPGTRGAGARPRRPATPGSARRAGTICRPSSRPATRTRSSAWAAPGPTPRGGRSRARAASSHSSESAIGTAEPKSRSRRLTPEGMNYICSHPLQRRFDGQQLGPGSYHPALAMNGRLISRRGL